MVNDQPNDGNSLDAPSASVRDCPNESSDSKQIESPGDLLSRFGKAGARASANLICEIELTRFDTDQRHVLLPLLWNYILQHRDSNHQQTLVAVGSAIRKYIANMPLEDMGQLATLLEPGHKSVLPIELEIEVAKMIYRNFEVYPPSSPDPHPELARRLWEMVQTYTNPRLLLRDKYSAIASLSIAALLAMRSEFAEPALRLAADSPYRWFAELVGDGLDRLHERWSDGNPLAAAWLAALPPCGRALV